MNNKQEQENKRSFFKNFKILSKKTKLLLILSLLLTVIFSFLIVKGITYNKYGVPNTYTIVDSFIMPGEEKVRKEGFEFIGWHEQEDLSDSVITEFKAGQYGDKTFYAEWKKPIATINIKVDPGCINNYTLLVRDDEKVYIEENYYNNSNITKKVEVNSKKNITIQIIPSTAIDSFYKNFYIWTVNQNQVLTNSLEYNQQYSDYNDVEVIYNDTTDYFYMEPNRNNTYIGFEIIGSLPNISLEYSLNNTKDFKPFTFGSYVTANTGQKVYFRGNNNSFTKDTSNYVHALKDVDGYSIKVGGNIMSLLNKKCELNDLTGYNNAFLGLFHNFGLNLTSIMNLKLPATTLATDCYNQMFSYCSGLTTLPSNLLPATKLASQCYYYMFYNCTGLKVHSFKIRPTNTLFRVPASGAGTTASNALYNMFSGTSGTFIGTPSINTTYYIGDGLNKGDLIDIDNKEYRVLDINGPQIKLLAMYDAAMYKQLDPSTISIGGYTCPKYKGGTLDNYLENTFYPSLSFKNAIISSNIYQYAYYFYASPDDKGNTKYTYQYQLSWDDSNYNNANLVGSVSVGSRHCYVLDLKDIYDYFGKRCITSSELNEMFFKTTNRYGRSSPYYVSWLRSAYTSYSGVAWGVHGDKGSLNYIGRNSNSGVRPAFIVDISKVKFTVK